jgi:hypothetical protein
MMTVRERRVAQWKEAQALRIRQVELLNPAPAPSMVPAMMTDLASAMAEYLEKTALLEPLPPDGELN